MGDKLPDHVRFHNHLFGLGKTNTTDPEEVGLMGTWPVFYSMDKISSNSEIARMNNSVFLFEVSQAFDRRDGRDAQYREDLSEFLGLSTPLGPFNPVPYDSPDFHFAIGICDDEFRPLREELLQVGKNASRWIQTYLLPLPDVTVSSPEHFRELLQTWPVDPCDSTH